MDFCICFVYNCGKEFSRETRYTEVKNKRRMLDFIIHVGSGAGRARRYKKILEKYMDERKIPYKFHVTEHAGHATEIARELSLSGECEIISVGGDGTLNEVLNGIEYFDNANLGVIPAGSGNDFATAIGIPEKDPIRALEIILENKPIFTDYMQMGNTRGINVIGTGIDVDVLRRYYKWRGKPTKVKYLFALIASLFKFNFYKMHFNLSGKEDDRYCMLAAAANGRFFGGGVEIAPKAIVDDGLMDVITVGHIKKTSIPGAFIALKKHKILSYPATRMERTDKIEISGENLVALQVDGEIYENTPFKIELIHNKLKFFRENTSIAEQKE